MTTKGSFPSRFVLPPGCGASERSPEALRDSKSKPLTAISLANTKSLMVDKMPSHFQPLSPTNSGSEGEGMDGGVSVGGGAEGAQKRKAQSVFSTKEEEEIYCRHIVQIRIPNEFGKEEVSPDCPCCKLRQQLPVDKKLAAQQIAGKKKAREDLLEQAAWLATDIANLVESKRERQQEEEYLLKVIFRLREEQEAWDKEQAKLPSEQRTERNVFDEYVRHQRRVAKQKMRSLLEDF
ncbi:hypothetical protein D0864_00507 [Hortaea werneckii]|uniref:Uncharacterized protein n=1 Tax=Hortaea werneckii TaxID=91943 RepID=A0A3M7HJA0_HORWE|nr:hypothetical protein D0864_00507 [Hortaea werneckii]RMZ15223.1 hypothetical protein D0862_01762 [Hortaea werneckii]